MSDMIERVAKAIWEDRYPDMPWDGPDRDFLTTRETMRGHARAAIEAMRKPTEKMQLAGGECEHVNGCSVGYLTCKDVWQTMIDKALK